MKNLLKKINTISFQVEMGFYTESESKFKLRQFRSDIHDKFEEGSDEFIQLINALMDLEDTIINFFIKEDEGEYEAWSGGFADNH